MLLSSRKKYFFYLVSFVEGGCVMATELLGAKLLAPYFGTSLYVWACVMALTLGGLACGYFFGGRLSTKKNHEKILMACVFLAAAYISFLPVLSPYFIYVAQQTTLIPAVLICSAIVLLPPVFLMGMVSPLLIKSITENQNDAGKKAGEIYAVSTIGGICFTFLTAFYAIPNWGLTISLLVTASLLALFPLFYFLRNKIFFPMLFFIVSVCFSFKNNKETGAVIYKEEGLLGTIEVKDVVYKSDTSTETTRFLLINNIVQSCINTKTLQSKLGYTSVLEKNMLLINSNPKSALVLGLGGGIISSVLQQKNIHVTAVELDSRVIEVAKKYFNLSSTVNVINDDARHALYQLQNKFDMVVIDLFNGEVTPSHILSVESFTKIKGLLNPNGFIFINTYGYLNSAAGQGNLILLKTLRQADFTYKICYTGDALHDDFRNILIFASLKEISQPLYDSLNEKINVDNIIATTDDKPSIEFANAEATKRWRYTYLKNFISN